MNVLDNFVVFPKTKHKYCFNIGKVTTLKKPRSQERGFVFYREIELAQNFGVKYKTSIARAMRSFLFATWSLIKITTVILARNRVTKASIF